MKTLSKKFMSLFLALTTVFGLTVDVFNLILQSIKLKKLTLGVLIGTLAFNSLAPSVYAMSNSNTQSQIYSQNIVGNIEISDQEMQKFEDDLVKMMKDDKILQEELKAILKDNDNDNSTEQILRNGKYQIRSVGSSAAKKAIKAVANWFKRNGMKVWNKLPSKVKKYFAAQGAAGFINKLGQVVDAYTDISDSIDEFVYNVLRGVLPSQGLCQEKFAIWGLHEMN
ncbi:MAG: hypothetical protein ACFWUM_02030 [Eubacteriales bacterium]|jgi:hypothetical protein